MERACRREIPRVRFGRLHAHAVDPDQAIDLIVERAHCGLGGFVLTPNVDHIAIAQRSTALVDAYRRVLPLPGRRDADGAASRGCSGCPCGRKVSGSDVFEPLLARCAEERLPVFFLGSTAELNERAILMLKERYPAIEITGYDDSYFDPEGDPADAPRALRRARASGAADHHLLAATDEAGAALAVHVGVRARGRRRHRRRAQLLRR